jgi:divalent metal cation (Fe/Co/Zn/Cd) transporter
VRRRGRTLAWSLALSAWAPPTTAIAVALSRSTTQLADFVRRTVELVAVAVAYLAYRRATAGDVTPEARARWERRARTATRIALVTSGLAVLAVAAGRGGGFRPGGTVAVGLAVAALGLLVNGGFWRRYARFERSAPSPVIASQRVLYRAKCLVDGAVLLSLTTVALAPGRPVARWADLAGSLVVGGYLLWSARRPA